MFFNVLYLFRILIAENRYKHEAMVDGEPVLFEILDTCPKVRRVWIHVVFGIDLDMNSQKMWNSWRTIGYDTVVVCMLAVFLWFGLVFLVLSKEK